MHSHGLNTADRLDSYRAYSREQTPEARGQYEFAEQEAAAKRAGLWADKEPIAPRDWRKMLQKRGAP